MSRATPAVPVGVDPAVGAGAMSEHGEHYIELVRAYLDGRGDPADMTAFLAVEVKRLTPLYPLGDGLVRAERLRSVPGAFLRAALTVTARAPFEGVAPWRYLLTVRADAHTATWLSFYGRYALLPEVLRELGLVSASDYERGHWVLPPRPPPYATSAVVSRRIDGSRRILAVSVRGGVRVLLDGSGPLSLWGVALRTGMWVGIARRSLAELRDAVPGVSAP